MRKTQETIVRGKQICIGLEDSKKTWRICVRCVRMIVHDTGMPARYEVLLTYLLERYPERGVQFCPPCAEKLVLEIMEALYMEEKISTFWVVRTRKPK